jgi:hypothetical protein
VTATVEHRDLVPWVQPQNAGEMIGFIRRE